MRYSYFGFVAYNHYPAVFNGSEVNHAHICLGACITKVASRVVVTHVYKAPLLKHLLC